MLCKQGKSLRRDAGVHEIIVTPRREHSPKPDELYHRIERYVGGEGPFLELFARQSRPGWTTWGLEKTKFDPPGTSEATQAIAQPRGFHRIRHYGLFAKGSCADNIARARDLLAVSKPQGKPTSAAVDPSKPTCPCCGGRMITIEVFTRGATPRHRPTAPTIAIRIDTS